jgi:osmotically-inducible protein OsmY
LQQFPDSDDEGGRDIARSATTLQAVVKEALTSAYDINASEITVSTVGTYVILEGRVRYRGDIDRAIEIAEEIAGSGMVKSRLAKP